uniref:Uncharacterized protein n=1 Tax=Arundo donax TaxID=35708 RepID=A0A0A9DY47_ARUDO
MLAIDITVQSICPDPISKGRDD